jgi:hypothetical protein
LKILTLIFAIVAFSLALFSSCGDKNGGSSDDPTDKPVDPGVAEPPAEKAPPAAVEAEVIEKIELDLTKIEAFVITKSGGARSKSLGLIEGGSGSQVPAPSKLMALEGGEFKPFNLDSEGIMNYRRVYVAEAYFYFSTIQGNTYGANECHFYSMRREDGKVTCIPNIYATDGTVAGLESGTAPLQTNEKGDIAFIVGKYTGSDLPDDHGWNAMIKADFSSGEMVYSIVYAKNNYIEDMSVSASGDVIARIAPDSGRETIIINLDGTIQSLGEAPHSRIAIRGADHQKNDFFVTQNEKIERWYLSDGKYVVEDYFDDTERLYRLGNIGYFYRSSKAIYTVITGWGDTDPSSDFILEFGLEGQAPRKIANADDTRGVEYFLISGNDEQLVAVALDPFGESSLVRYDITTDTFTTLIKYEEYVFRDISMDSTGKISFAAERLSDSKSVAGEVGLDNVVTIYDLDATKITQLIRIR